MNLRELLSSEPSVLQEQLIGTEIKILGRPALLLGIQEVEWEGGESPERAAKISLLYEQPPVDRAAWEKDWETDTEEYMEMTARQRLLEELDAEEKLFVTDIKCFQINGIPYETIMPEAAAEYGSIILEAGTYEEVRTVRYYAEKNVIPDAWMDKELEQLALAGYYVDTEVFHADWNGSTPDISVEMKEPDERFPVGKIMELSLGQYEPPKAFSIKGKNGEDIPVRICGLYLEDMWAALEDSMSRDHQDWDEEALEELEDYCERDERLLTVEYSAPDGIQLNFYTKEYLDGPAEEPESQGAWGIFFRDDSHQEKTAIAAVVPEDFSGPVEMELLSYVKFGS